MTTSDQTAPAQAAPPKSAPVAPPSQPAWTDALSPDLKLFADAKGLKSPADALRAYADIETRVGEDRIALPKDGAWDAPARQKLGIPDTPDKYAFRRPELPAGVPYDEALEKAALPVAHKLGLTPHQLQGLVDFIAQHRLGEFGALAETHRTAMTAAERELRTEYGVAYDQHLALAARAARRFGGEELVAALDATGFGNNPYLVRAFAKIGAMLAEDALKSGGGGNRFALTPAGAQAEIARIQGEASGDPKHAYWRKDHPEHTLVVKRLEDLHRMAHVEEDKNDRARGTINPRS